MSEHVQMVHLAVALMLIGGFAWLYALGGRSDRAIRWLAGGLWFAAGGNVLAVWSSVWSPWMLLAFLGYPAALTFGYGDKVPSNKARKRAWCGFLMGLASGTLLLPTGHPILWLAQIALSIAGSVGYGLTNPMSAVGEEGQIALCYVCLTPFALI